ncbi:hypothetical protein EV421DRAFT_1744156 [Armillaria borealis]|uniref:Uncharacterized protein n=1 Tax=Armillaria borealis TaxID=47425 RepID=A0AA39ME43_9AGAR|nr:hypothetical protein EV421DRAFT_1744156 [Armillaria borealis]
MSKGHTEDPSVPLSPHSSPQSPQDFPPLPTRPTPPASTRSKKSWISGKKGEGSSSLSMRASRSLRDLLRGSKRSQEKVRERLSPLLDPVPSSPPALPPLDLLSSSQTLRAPTTTLPNPPPLPSTAFGLKATTSLPLPEIDSHAPPHVPHGPQTHHPHSTIPPGPYTWIPKPTPPPLSSPPTYDELQQQLRRLLSESTQPRLSSDESPPATSSSPPTIAAQVVQDWRTSQMPNIGEGYEASPLQKLMPSMRSNLRSDAPSHYASSRGGSKGIAPTERSESLGGTMDSPSIHGWSTGSVQGKMTLEEWASEYTSIWNTCHTDLTTEVSWRLSEAGAAWEKADPVEQEDIISHSATVQAIKIFNEFYPRYTLPLAAPYQSRYQQNLFPTSPPTMPMPTS